MILNDVTIREGGQMPGREYTVDMKVEAGLALDSLGIDFLQPGFAVTGDTNASAIEELAERCSADVVSIARAVEGDVEAALDAGADVVEVFGPLSDRQLEHTVGQSREEMLSNMRAAVDLARDGGAVPHLTLVDAFRTDVDLVVDAFDRFDAVPMVTLADTVGAMAPQGVEDYLTDLSDAGADLGRTGIHLHDDMGVATANALVAAKHGVGKADVSVASLGERAGNTALEELVVSGVVGSGDSFGVDESQLIPACRDALAALDETVDGRKAVLGKEVTQHESGIHVAAMLSDPGVMEPYDPARFGGERTLLFGPKTGTGGARRLLERTGRDPDEDLVSALLDELAERGPVELDDAVTMAERL
jgi:isopropylmalate/homocitrate/citramalate synthase